MNRSFQLRFGNLALEISLEKSFMERVGFKTGYKGQPLKMIRVITKDPELERVTSKSEIAHIVQYDEIESLVQDDDGNYLVVDKSNLDRIAPSSNVMKVIKTVPISAVPFCDIEGSHYFVHPKKSKKGKKSYVTKENAMMYNIVFTGLREKQEAFLIRYAAMKTIKHAILYPRKNGLYLSNLIGSNYQKERESDCTDLPLDSKLAVKAYEKLIEGTRKEKLGKYRDPYGDALEKLRSATIKGETVVAEDEGDDVSSTSEGADIEKLLGELGV